MSKWMECVIIKLKEELQMAEVDYFFKIKDGNQALDKLDLLYQKLKTSEAKLFTVVVEGRFMTPNF